MGDTKKSLYISLGTGALSIAFSWVFLKIFYTVDMFRFFIEGLFRVNDIKGTEVLVLALGFSLAQIINCVVLWYMFNREHKTFSEKVLKTLFQSFSASIIMGFASYGALNYFSNIFNLNKVIGIFLQGFCSGLVGIVVGVIMLKLLKSQELEEVIKTLHKKFWRSKPMVPDISASDL